MLKPDFKIDGKVIGSKRPVYIVAEMSANHNQNLNHALKIIRSAKKAGADAVKIQTYTADTMTIDSASKYFYIKGTVWNRKKLYTLYREASTPWNWQSRLKMEAEELGMDFFSTPFDETSVDFLETLSVPAYKIASFELNDIPFIRYVAQTKKPIILSTGMATLKEIESAISACLDSGNNKIALLKCTSAYPAPLNEMNLNTLCDMKNRFQCPIGLSDHTLDSVSAIASVALGGCIIEKHLTLSRKIGGPDAAFSLEPNEFKEMVKMVRSTQISLGTVKYETARSEEACKPFRRSLFVVKDIKKGELLTRENVRSIRPGYGLAPVEFDKIIGKKACANILRGTPLDWDLIED